MSLMHRALHSSDPWTRWAMEALLRRGHPCPYNVHQPVLSLTDLRAGFWVSSLIAYGASGRAVLSHQQASLCPALAPMSPLHGLVLVSIGPLTRVTTFCAKNTTCSWILPNGRRTSVDGRGALYRTFSEVPWTHSRYGPRMHLFRSFLVSLGMSLQ